MSTGPTTAGAAGPGGSAAGAGRETADGPGPSGGRTSGPGPAAGTTGPGPAAASGPASGSGTPPVDSRAVSRTVRGGWFGFAGSGVNALFGFVLVAIVTRAVGAGGAGAVFTGVAVFTILANAFKLGADTGLVRFVSRDLATTGGSRIPALLRTAVVPGLVASTAGAAVLLFTPALAAALLPDLGRGDAVALVRLFAVFLPVTTVSLVLLGATRGYGTVLPFVGVEQIGKPVLRVLIAVPVALIAPGVLALSAAWLLPSAAGAAIAWIALRRCRRTRTETPVPPPVPGPPTPTGRAAPAHRVPAPRAAGAQSAVPAVHVPGPRLCGPRAADSVDPAAPGAGAASGAPSPGREFWAFAGPRAVSSVFDITAVWVGVILLSALGTSEEAGIYTAIGRLVTAGTLLQLAVRLAVAPHISRLMAGGNEAQAHHLHRLSTRWIVLFSLPLFAALAVFPGTVLSVFGPGFDEGAAALVVLCAASAANVSVGNAQTVILMAGRSSWNLAVAGAAFAVQIGAGLLLVPRYGVVGAAVAWGLALVVDNGASAFLVRHRLGFRTMDRGYAAAAGLGLLSVGVTAVPSRLLLGDSLPGTVLGISLGIAVFSSGLWRYRVPLGVREFSGALRKRDHLKRTAGGSP